MTPAAGRRFDRPCPFVRFEAAAGESEPRTVHGSGGQKQIRDQSRVHRSTLACLKRRELARKLQNVGEDSWALRRGGRLVMYGHYGTTIGGRKSARRIAIFYLYGALVFAGNLLPNGKRVLTFQVAKLRDRRPEWFREDATALFKLLADRKIAPVVAERIPLAEAWRAHENLGHGGITGKQVLMCDPRS